MTLTGNTDETNGYNSVIKNGESNNANHVKAVICPIGSVTAWLKDYTNTPSLPDGWVECNGQTLSDSDSPYDGQTIPDLNSAVDTGLKGRFLRGHTASGLTESDQNKEHNHTYTVYNSAGTTDTNAGGNNGGSGNSLNTGNSGSSEARPYNYSVVWIMRIK